MDDNSPVLVGVAAFQQRLADYREALEPLDIMVRVLEDAAADAGSLELLKRAGAPLCYFTKSR